MSSSRKLSIERGVEPHRLTIHPDTNLSTGMVRGERRQAKKPDLAIDRTIKGDANSLWNGLEYVFFDGFKTIDLGGFSSLNECVFFHAASRTLILTDTAFHFDESFPIITQFASRAIGGYKKFSPSILERVATKDKEKVRESVKNVLSWDFERVIVAHGSIIETQGKQKFQEGYEQFLGRYGNVII